MTLGESDFGVYVHVPFCRMLCTYCDFVKYRGLDEWYARYAAALLREAKIWQRPVARETRHLALLRCEERDALGHNTPHALPHLLPKACSIYLRRVPR